MPPTDGFDEPVLMRCRGECGSSSPTATSVSRRSRIGADRRSAMRCVSRARAFCRAAPTARRSTESAGARTCSSRSQPRASASSEPVRSSRSASSSRNRATWVCGGGVESAQTQVLTDVLLMLRDRLLPAGVGVDRLGVGAQLQGREPQDLPVDLQGRLSGESAEHTHEGDLVRETQPVVGAPSQGDLAAVGLEEGGIADQAGAGDAVRRGRARPDLGAHPRGPRPGEVLGPEAWSPEGVAGRLTARRQGGRDPHLRTRRQV